MTTKTKPQGAWEVRRRIRIPALRDPDTGVAVERLLSELPSLRAVGEDLPRQRVSVIYDASTLDYRTIIKALAQGGYPPLDSWWTRFMAGCYQYTDTNARENAAARPSPCCNKPPR